MASLSMLIVGTALLFRCVYLLYYISLPRCSGHGSSADKSQLSIVLDLSWIDNLATLLMFLLILHSQPKPYSLTMFLMKLLKYILSKIQGFGWKCKYILFKCFLTCFQTVLLAPWDFSSTCKWLGQVWHKALPSVLVIVCLVLGELSEPQLHEWPPVKHTRWPFWKITCNCLTAFGKIQNGFTILGFFWKI